MPHVPDYVTSKTAEGVQAFFIITAIIFGLISWAVFEAGNDGSGTALIAFGLFVIGCLIKTRKKFAGGAGIYK